MTANTKKSFRFKLIVDILIVSIFVFALIFSGCAYFSIKQVSEGTNNTIQANLEVVKRSLDSGLENIEVASKNVLSSMVYEGVSDVDYDFIHRSLDCNQQSCGMTFGFNPEIRTHSPYSMRDGKGGYIDLDIAKNKAYWEAKWYSVPAQTGKTYWSNPFIESNGNLIVAYNTPYYNNKNKLIGVLAMDLNLNVISDSLQALCPYPNGNIYIIDSRGRFIAHPDKSLIYNHSIDQGIREKVMSGESGYTFRQEGKQRIYSFYAPDKKTGWTIYMDVPTTDIGHYTSVLLTALILDIIIGIILLIVVCFVVVGKITKPIEIFAKAAQRISHGHFDVELPPIKDHNELWDLRQALAAMEVDLNSYISKLEDTSKHEARIENELNIAREIQNAMVPKVFPPLLRNARKLDIFAAMTPAQEVGGDLYDFVVFGKKLYFCIGDVSGKGVPASLFMAITRSLFRSLASEDKTPGQIAYSLNNSICQGNELNMFITMFIGALDLDTGDLTVCSCGHNHPVTGKIVPLGQSAELSTFMNDVPNNIAIGVIDGFDYKEASMKVTFNSMILLYTDGITEAENAQKALFGEDRLLSSVSDSLANTSGSARIIIDRLLESVRSFTAGAVQNDDITALCIIYKEK